MRTLGLTGGIGSGKSVVARRFVACGAALVDTDAIAHALTAPGGAAIDAIRARFGDAMVRADGALDRDAMRRLVFERPAARRELEAILHPRIGAVANAQTQAAAAAGAPAVVLDVPLLVEGGDRWRARCDRIVVVDCRVETQVERVVARSGWSREQVERVVAQQATRAQRRACADAVVHNDGLDLDTLHAQVDALAAAWFGGAPRPRA